MNAVMVIARLTWMRLVRGRAIWLVLVLLCLPIGAAWLVRAVGRDWSSVEWLAHVTLVSAAILLSGAVGEELENKTHTYLWARPISRDALILGKFVAIVPALLLASLATTAAAYLIAGESGWQMLRTLASHALAGLAASAVSVAVGALFPKHPLVVAVGYLLAADSIMYFLPASLRQLSILTHADALANGEAPGQAAVALFLHTAFWLGLAIWRGRTAGYAGVDR